MVTWYEIVRRIFNNIQDIYINCGKCTSPIECIDEFPLTTPTDITVFKDCCACILGQVMEDINEVKEIYIPIEDSMITLYKIDDVLIEISEDTAVVIPLDKVEDFIEMIRDMGYENIDKIIQFIEGTR